MAVSMTGYGRGEIKTEDKEISAEIRSLNNRFLDISVKLPKSLYVFEEEIKNLVKKYISRGRVNVTITLKDINNNGNLSHSIDLENARAYWQLLKNLKKSLKIEQEIKLEHLLALPNIFLCEVEEVINDEKWTDVQEVITQALKNVKKMRLDEGKELSADLSMRIQILNQKIEKIEQLSAIRIEKEIERVRERIASLGTIEHIDENRLEMEIAILANRMDVTEECVRLKSHNKLFLESLDVEETIGRKLNFLLQEMTREANTIGAKAYDAEISHLVVDIKEEVEKLREQVQNIE